MKDRHILITLILGAAVWSAYAHRFELKTAFGSVPAREWPKPTLSDQNRLVGVWGMVDVVGPGRKKIEEKIVEVKKQVAEMQPTFEAVVRSVNSDPSIVEMRAELTREAGAGRKVTVPAELSGGELARAFRSGSLEFRGRNIFSGMTLDSVREHFGEQLDDLADPPSVERFGWLGEYSRAGYDSASHGRWRVDSDGYLRIKTGALWAFAPRSEFKFVDRRLWVWNVGDQVYGVYEKFTLPKQSKSPRGAN